MSSAPAPQFGTGNRAARRKPRFRLIVEEEYQPLSVVSPRLWAALALGMALLLAVNTRVLKGPVAVADEMGPPPSDKALAALSLGDPIALSRLVMFRVQAFDNQAGVSIPYSHLDYPVVRDWLAAVLQMNPASGYPLMSAARVYATIKDPPKQRLMFDFVHEEFLKDPDRRWEWLAHAATIAKAQMDDPDLALRYATDLREHTTPGQVPGWARQLEAIYREERSEYEASARLMEELLASGEITDQHEFTFLFDRLSAIIEKMWERGEIRTEAELDEKLARLDNLRLEFLRRQGIGG